MKMEYEFKLNPAYCLYNGVAVAYQDGANIKLIIENYNDEILKARIKRAFINYVEFVLRQEDCGESFRRLVTVEFEKGTQREIRLLVSKLYGLNNGVSKLNLELEENDEVLKRKKEAAAVILLDSIILEAKNKNATDIHIEGNGVRFRINGFLEDFLDINFEHKNELVQRIKLLAGMNSLEKRKNQEGHFVYGHNSPIFIRVSSVAVINNQYDNEESLVLRILDTSRLPLGINFLGFNQIQLEKINEICQLKNGLVLVAGPTCSGKSTTVASILVEIQRMNLGKLKIISLEDPPEYVIPGVSQIKVSRDEKGKSFNENLDFIFRQDPDVIMIGEIRDKASAETAIRAGLTGHLVFATVHTASPGEGVLRLENLGIKRKVITSILKCVIVQELKYIEGTGNLYGDVAIPNYDFSSFVNEEMGEEEIDSYFNHYTNYINSLGKAIKLMGKRKIKKAEIWGNVNNEKIHKNIV